MVIFTTNQNSFIFFLHNSLHFYVIQLPTHDTPSNPTHKITLAVAPMEGIMDTHLRATLSAIGGMDYFVSEFVRVSHYPIPTATFARLIPELKQEAKTASGHPVHTQLLGSSAELMAESAWNAVQAGSQQIDLNFGCPAKRVNGHGGGSYLLQSPETIYNIVNEVRRSLPDNVPLSAKIRLGYEDETLFRENVEAVERGGANILTIHGRTKKDGYKAPARWEAIGHVRQSCKMEIVANGDIMDEESLKRCIQITGCSHFMIGRASLSNPFLFCSLRNGEDSSQLDSEQISDALSHYALNLRSVSDPRFVLGRLKQWCAHLSKNFPHIMKQLQSIRRASDCETILELASLK